MTQFDFGTINPTTKSGTALAGDLNSWRDALYSAHRGATAPSYLVRGLQWANTTPSTDSEGSVTLDTGASGSVDSITVDGVEVMSGVVAFNGTLDQTATDVAANITAHTSVPDYDAAAVGAVITITALGEIGDAPNTFVVVSSATVITTSDADFAGGITVVDMQRYDGATWITEVTINESNNTMVAAQYEGADVPSATTTDIWTNDGDTIHITGTTAITSLGTAPRAGAWKKVIFDGILTFTDGANLNLPGSANITTAANDFAFVYAETTTLFRVLYFKADGTAVAAGAGGISNVVEDTTPELGGPLDTLGQAIDFSEGTPVASTATPNIWQTDGNTVHITGTTTITGFGAAPRIGAWRWLIFDDVLTLTDDANLNLQGGGNILTAADDFAFVYAETTTLFKVIYFKVSGLPTVNPIENIIIAVGDESTPITTGLAKVSFRMPYAFTLLAGNAGVRATLTVTSSSGIPTIDINEAGATILTTKLTIDATDLTSLDAAAAVVIGGAGPALADDALITVDIDVAGTGAAGLKVMLRGRQT